MQSHPIMGELTTEFYRRVPKEPKANAEYRRNLRTQARNDVGLQRHLKQAFKVDPLYYLSTMCYLHEPRQRTAIPWISWPFQDEAIELLIDSLGRYDVVIEKSRDMGASWMTMFVCEWAWHFHPHSTFLLGSRTEDYVDAADHKSLMWKIDFLHRHQDPWLVPLGDRAFKRYRNLENGSAINGEATNKNFGVGGRNLALVLDEFAKVDIARQIKDGTDDVADCRWFVSTHNGTYTTFNDLCKQGDIKDEQGNWIQRKLTLHWTRHPKKAAGLYWVDLDGVRKPRSPWYDRQAKRRPAQAMAQDVDIDPQGSSWQFFEADHLERVRQKDCRPALLRGRLDHDRETGQPGQFVPDPQGPLFLWLNLDPSTHKPVPALYVAGADVSFGAGKSNSVCSVALPETGEKVAELAISTLNPIAFATYVVALCRWFAGRNGGAKLIWENNGLGFTFGKQLEQLNYLNIFWMRQEERYGSKVTGSPGWHASPDRKKRLLEEYRQGLGTKFINHSEPAILECAAYIHDPKHDGVVVHSESLKLDDPTGARSNHGDRVVADALVYRLVQEERPARKVVKTTSDDQPVPAHGFFARMRAHEEAEREEDLAWL